MTPANWRLVCLMLTVVSLFLCMRAWIWMYATSFKWYHVASDIGGFIRKLSHVRCSMWFQWFGHCRRPRIYSPYSYLCSFLFIFFRRIVYSYDERLLRFHYFRRFFLAVVRAFRHEYIVLQSWEKSRCAAFLCHSFLREVACVLQILTCCQLQYSGLSSINRSALWPDYGMFWWHENAHWCNTSF